MLCATGFRDTTRIASGSPEMWRDIAAANQPMIDRALAGLIEDLQLFRTRLAAGDSAAIERFFVEAKTRRDLWSAAGASLTPE